MHEKILEYYLDSAFFFNLTFDTFKEDLTKSEVEDKLNINITKRYALSAYLFGLYLT